MLLGLDELRDLIGRADIPHVAEVGGSYEYNAALKARAYAAWSGRRCFADDSGIEFECLGGLPGIYTARFGLERVVKMVGRLHDLEARLVCCVAYAEPSGRLVSVTRSISGVVNFSSSTFSAAGSLPYSHIFFPLGHSRSLANLIENRVLVSHRGDAFLCLLRAL